MRKFPVYLVVDVSESMIGEAHTQLENGIRQIVEDLLQDPYALETVWLSVIAFAGRPRTLTPLTEICEFMVPHLPVGGGTGLGHALTHLMVEIDRNATTTTPDKKGDWKPLIFLMTDGHPTDNPEPAIARWTAKYAQKANMVAVSIGGGADDALLKRLTDEVFAFDDTKPGAFVHFIQWITNSVSASTQSVLAGGNLTLSKMAPEIEVSPASRAYGDTDDRYAVFVGRCSKSKAPYVAKYEKHIEPIESNDPRLAALFSSKKYVLQTVVPVQGDYFELSDNLNDHQSQVSASELVGQPDCPHCQASFGMAVCGCGNIHCVQGDGEATCPWCQNTGYYSSGPDAGGLEISRGRG
ncbi:TerY-C metal binding domain-containing protein [Pseudovibrio sp. POLY-S9]|uniref:TerY-C metal binding domain-containing protein n=1 Tax=Pseudovibrio sp. POLY-S9 TaxID=1576596 RepID=UPI000709572C|nr:TerY-C metal binding domain-containing protein [Pseudovibrio sp. POLY-S9]